MRPELAHFFKKKFYSTATEETLFRYAEKILKKTFECNCSSDN